jgi:signal transduction histidine kinase
MHGGSITAHSDGLGKGSRFIVRLPLCVERA